MIRAHLISRSNEPTPVSIQVMHIGVPGDLARRFRVVEGGVFLRIEPIVGGPTPRVLPVDRGSRVCNSNVTHSGFAGRGHLITAIKVVTVRLMVLIIRGRGLLVRFMAPLSRVRIRAIGSISKEVELYYGRDVTLSIRMSLRVIMPIMRDNRVSSESEAPRMTRAEGIVPLVRRPIRF